MEFTATESSGASSVPDLMAYLQPDEIRKRLAQARDEAGFTQPEFADLLGVGKDTVQNYEGKRKTGKLPYDKINEWSDITNRPVKWILWGDDDEAAQLADRLDDVDQQLADIKEVLSRLLPAPGEPITAETIAVMLTTMAQVRDRFEEWAEQMGRGQIGKRELDRQRRRVDRARDRQRQPDEASAG